MALEETLAQLANSQLSQSVPSLKPYLIGFQEISSNEDETSALGVEVAMIGNTCIFIPVIYQNGSIFPMDLMYIPELDQFLPTQDNWISYIKSKKSDLAIKVLDKDIRKRRRGGANSVSLSIPDHVINKFASASRDAATELNLSERRAIVKYASDCMSDIFIDTLKNTMDCAFPKKVTDLQGKITGVPSMMDPAMRKLAADEGVLTAKLMTDPDVHNMFATYYSDADMQKLVMDLAENKKLTAKTATPAETADYSKQPVRVIKISDHDAVAKLSDEEKGTVIREGITIKDDRGLIPSKVSEIAPSSMWQTFNAATGTVAKVLTSTGKQVLVYVVKPTDDIGHFDKNSDICVIPLEDADIFKSKDLFDPKVKINPRNCVFTASEDTVVQELATPFLPDSLKGYAPSDILKCYSENKSNSEILIVSPEGKAYCVQSYSNPSEGSWVHSDDVSVLTGMSFDLWFRDAQDKYNAHNCNHLIVVDDSASLKVSKDTLFIPSSYKIFSVVKNPTIVTGALATLGTYRDVLKRASNKGFEVKVHFDDTGFSVSDENGKEALRMTKAAAAKYLVQTYALNTDSTFGLLRKAAAKRNNSYHCLIKMAADSIASIDFGVAADEDPYKSEVDEVELTGESDQPQGLTDKERETIDNAAASGVKEIFDVSILKTLAGNAPSVQLIQERIPSLFAALDSAARILYLCRAGDSIVEAYGNTRATTLEQTLRKLIADIGDLIIFLQQGKVDSYHELLEGQLGQTLG